MKRFFTAGILMLFLSIFLPLPALAQPLLLPVGQIAGLHIQDDSLTVAAFDDVLGQSARESGLQIGDRLVKIQGQPVSRVQDIQDALIQEPAQVELVVLRGDREKSLSLTPQESPTGLKLGVYLRQGISGIGTITYYDPDTGTFGTLGHGVSGSRGDLTQLHEGTVYRAEISGIVPGKPGKPGLLKGLADENQKIGSVFKNTPQGVFGETSCSFGGQPLPLAAYEEIHPGPASIRSTITGSEPREYSVELLKIYPMDRADCRNFLIRVTDPRLLSATGGIVQGMSGSPILQDGRIIGAVTHVMVSDPTTGYGIFIGNMLDAAA